jgi:hypothetical protein
MAQRNRGDPGLSGQIATKLREARAELAAARAAGTAANKHAEDAETARRWVKF